jgi:hypothetical protein
MGRLFITQWTRFRFKPDVKKLYFFSICLFFPLSLSLLLSRRRRSRVTLQDQLRDCHCGGGGGCGAKRTGMINRQKTK